MMAMSWPYDILSRRVLNLVPGRVLAAALALGLTGPARAQSTVPAAASVAPASTVAPRGPEPTAADSVAAARPGTWQLLRHIRLKNPGAASLDRRGSLYVADADDNLRQYSAEGLPLNTFSPPLPGHVAQVEAWNMSNILIFNDDRQQLILLDRFLAPLSQVRLADYLDGTVRVATLAPDGQIWLLDESSLVLRELDPNTLRLVQSTPLDLIIGRTRPDFRFIRQYQNNTYLVDHTTGIYVFDNLGNYKKKIPFPGLGMVGFRGDELYYLSGGQLHFFHLYNLTERTLPLPANVAAEARQVLVSDEYGYVFTAAGVLVYKVL